MDKYLLEMQGISKSFDGNVVLKDVSISLKYGEIHAVIGENGAGKSTLMKILAGVENKNAGDIYIEGRKVDIEDPYQAQAHGISTIFQEYQLIPSMNVIENIYLRRWPAKRSRWFPVINWGRTVNEARELFKYLDFDINPYAKISDLGAGQRKMVEIAKALCWKCKILVIGEATAALNDQDSEKLFNILRKSKEMGTSIFFISHKINEVLKLADRITILRDGSLIETRSTQDIDVESVVWKMAGKEFINRYPKIKREIGCEVLRVDHLKDGGILEDINFSLGQREILGLTGLTGSGRSAVARAICGLSKINSGRILINQREAVISSPAEAIKHRIGFISENRNDSLVHSFGIHENISLSDIKSVATRYNIDLALERRLCGEYVKRLGIKAKDVTQKTKFLSGGNQQKVMIARCLLTRSKIFVFDEPTKGLDIPSKVEVYNLMNEFILKDGAILFISSDLDELLGMCDRILVMHQGRIVKELSGNEMNEANIVYYASGGTSH